MLVRFLSERSNRRLDHFLSLPSDKDVSHQAKARMRRQEEDIASFSGSGFAKLFSVVWKIRRKEVVECHRQEFCRRLMMAQYALFVPYAMHRDCSIADPSMCSGEAVQ